MMFFTNTGRVYRLKAYEIPEAGRTARGTAIVNLLQLLPGEKITAIIPMRNTMRKNTSLCPQRAHGQENAHVRI